MYKWISTSSSLSVSKSKPCSSPSWNNEWIGFDRQGHLLHEQEYNISLSFVEIEVLFTCSYKVWLYSNTNIQHWKSASQHTLFGSFYKHVLTLIPAWISYHMHSRLPLIMCWLMAVVSGGCRCSGGVGVGAVGETNLFVNVDLSIIDQPDPRQCSDLEWLHAIDSTHGV